MNLKKLFSRKKLLQYIQYIIGYGMVFLAVWLFTDGKKYGAVGLIVGSIIIGGWRLWRARHAYLNIVDYGANMLRIMETQRKNEKLQAKKRKL